jgi:uncharacterized membrane protein
VQIPGAVRSQQIPHFKEKNQAMKNTLKGAVIASAVASLFASGAFAGDAPAPAAAKGVKCSGINSCTGKGSCKGASNSCAGKNSCKGTGWNMAPTEKDCTAKGGKVVVDAPKKG